MAEDKAMYDSREKAIRDQQESLNASRQEGLIEGEIKGQIKDETRGEIKGEMKIIRMPQEILNLPVSTDLDLGGKSLTELLSLTAELRECLQNRPIS